MPRRKYRRLRKDKVRRPRPGDQSLFDHARELNTNLALVDEEPIPILSTRKNVPDPDAKPKRGKGKVIGWYEIVGARTKIWVHGASDDDACGTFRVSKFHTSRDAPPKPTGRFKRDLEEGNYGLLRDGPHHTMEVNWRNAGTVIEQLQARRRRQARRREVQTASA